MTASVQILETGRWLELTGLNLLGARDTREPVDSVFDKDLDSGLQLALVQMKVINRSNSENALAGETLSDTVHERTANRAKVVRHPLAGSDRLVLLEDSQLVFATNVLQILIIDDEVGRKHRSGNLATVGAIADKGIYESGLDRWLK